MTHRLFFTIATLSLILPSAARSQQQRAVPPKASLLPTLTDPKKASAKHADPTEIEVRRPDSFDEQEWRVLHSLDTLSTERLVQLLLVYERLNNAAMLDVISRAILRQDPQNKDAIRARDGGTTEEIVRPAGYLEALANQVLAGRTISDPDSLPVQAMSLILGDRAAEAVTLLEKLRTNQFQGITFPYLDDLAYALSEAGRLSEAEAAYRAVIADSKMPPESIADARQSLPHILMKLRIDKLTKNAGRDGQALLAASAALLAEHPEDEDVQAFRVDSLQATQNFAEAIRFLLAKKKRDTSEGPWPWMPELGFSYFGARQYDQAIALFRDIQKDTRYDDRARNEAATMILEIQVTREIEAGSFAMERGDFVGANAVLDRLERNYRTHRDVLGYRSVYLSKTGRSDEALRELEAKKAQDTAAGLPFSQQDALADVFRERKEFTQAREATLLILNDPRYDEGMRIEATSRLTDITIAEAQNNAYNALRDGKRAQARAIAEDLRRTAPNRIEVRMMDAEIALAYFQTKAARDELLAIRAAPYPQGFAGMPFDAQNSLASALAMNGEWESGYHAYGEVVHAPEFNYEPEDIWQARWEQRRLLPWFSPTLSTALTHATRDEGDLTIFEQNYQSAWVNEWRFGVFARAINTKLTPNDLFVSAGRDTQFEGGVTATRRFTNNYFIEAMVGASQDDPIYGLHFGKLAFDSIGWSVGFMGNALSADSVNLQAFNGRENRAEFKLAGPLTDRINIDFNAWYQWNRVGGARLGSGYGASGQIDYVFQTETRLRPELSIGYAFDYSRFDAASSLPPRIRDEVRRAEVASPQVRKALGAQDEVRRALAGNFGNEVFDSLVDTYTNRHGIVFNARKHFENHFAFSASIGAYYAFDEDMFGFTGSVAAEYWINDRSMIYAELRTDTFGKGASSDGGTWEANVGSQVSF